MNRKINPVSKKLLGLIQGWKDISNYHVIDASGLMNDLTIASQLPGKFITDAPVMNMVYPGWLKDFAKQFTGRAATLIAGGVYTPEMDAIYNSVYAGGSDMKKCFKYIFNRSIRWEDEVLSVLATIESRKNYKNVPVINNILTCASDFIKLSGIRTIVNADNADPSAPRINIKYHFPFDYTIVMMYDIAVVYDRYTKDAANIYVVSISMDGDLQCIVLLNMLLDEKGSILSIHSREGITRDEAMEIVNNESLFKIGTMNEEKGFGISSNVLLFYSNCISSMTTYSRVVKIGTALSKMLGDSRITMESYRTLIRDDRFLTLLTYAEVFSEKLEKVKGDTSNMPTIFASGNEIIGTLLWTTTMVGTVIMSTVKSVRLRETPVKVEREVKRKVKGKVRTYRTNGETNYSTVSINIEDNYIIEGEPDVESLDENNEGVQHGKKSPHERRGNFAFYSPEKPLFGKYVGWFYRPATIVNGKLGKVSKTEYTISAEKERKK